MGLGKGKGMSPSCAEGLGASVHRLGKLCSRHVHHLPSRCSLKGPCMWL